MSQHTFYLAVEERVVVDLESELIKGLLMQPVKNHCRARARAEAGGGGGGGGSQEEEDEA